MSTYADFLETKARKAPDSGLDVDADTFGDHLKPFQAQLVAWALRRGRAALFAATGLGKTRMQLTWAAHAIAQTNGRGLILAPLAVVQQTIREAEAIGVPVAYVRDDADVTRLLTGPYRIAVTNYERLHLLRPERFDAVVLDESSILKAFSGTTKRALIAAFKATPFRLCCTATPAPNDIEELCNHADFLGVMSAQEMRSTFFIADSRGEFMRYRLKGHAHKQFYRWLASWAMALDRPSDLGFDDAGYDLPALHIRPVVVESNYQPEDALLTVEMAGVVERAAVRRSTLAARVEATVALVQAEPDERWLLWCGLNNEAAALMAALPGAVEVAGKDDPDTKAERLFTFAEGKLPILVTKPSVAGFGLNLQCCARMAFVGLGDSYESYHQAIRRCWRYGQAREVSAYVVVSDLETQIYENVRRKERQAQDWARGLVREVADYERAELLAGTSAADDYQPRRSLSLPSWLQTEGAA